VARFDRYMLSQLMMLFGFFSLVLISIYWINSAVRLFDWLIGDGQTVWVFLEFSALTLPGVIRIVLPVAGFAAAVYVTNRMSGDSELTVVQATGFSAFRVARPVMMFASVVLVMMLILTGYLVPLANRAYSERSQEVSQNAAARLFTEGRFLSPADGLTFYIRDITPSGELLDIFLSDTHNPSETTTYTADRAFLVKGENGPQLVMVSGLAQSLRHETNRLVMTRFDDFVYDIGALIPKPKERALRAGELTLFQLLSNDDAIAEGARRAPEALYAQGHGLIAESLLAYAAAVAGFSALIVGGFSRFGLLRQILIAIGIVVCIKMVEAGIANVVRTRPESWALYYIPALLGLTVVLAQLSIANLPQILSEFRQRSVGEAG
jgi:lipopolysaccharide export system permease protein